MMIAINHSSSSLIVFPGTGGFNMGPSLFLEHVPSWSLVGSL